MAPITRIGRSMSLVQSRLESRWRRSRRWIRHRRRTRVAAPPATTVSVEDVGGGVTEIRLLGGERRNVLGRSTITAIEEAVANPLAGTRAFVLTAETPDFCAGYDLIEASRGVASDLIAHDENFAPLRRSKIPIVAALQGNVIGGGLELALSADVRVASPEVRFAIPASKLGLVYSETGVRLLVSMLGEALARAMFVGGRDLKAETALSIGLISEMVGREQLRERAIALATEIASWSTLASSGNRQILDVIAGRIDADPAALRLASFAEHGDLAQSIHQFVTRRRPPAKVPTPVMPSDS
ncbi:MAG TPA: enoyl-CoA hydratase/isomerase family protein [Acidimicrobiales bacterium]